MESAGRGRIAILMTIGLFAGFCAGLFGVGGGIVLLPLLVLVLGLEQRRASGTTLAAMLPTSIAGTASYAAQGNVDWVAGLVLIIGAVSGSLIGTWLLHRLSQGVLRWFFIVFLIAVAIRMLFFVPVRGSDLEITPTIVIGLIALGLVTGIVSGLLGVGGGAIAIPGLLLIFGFGDLAAKGTSLFMMVPTVTTGTFANVLRGHVDLRVAALTGVPAIVGTLAGVATATVIPPYWGSILFAALLVYSAGQLVWQTAGWGRRFKG